MHQLGMVHESELVRVLAWDGRLLDVPAAEKGLCTNLDWCHFWYVQASRNFSHAEIMGFINSLCAYAGVIVPRGEDWSGDE